MKIVSNTVGACRSISVGSFGAQAIALVLCLWVMVGCTGTPGEAPTNQSAEAVLSSASLDLKVLTNSCGLNQVQDFFQIANTGSTSVAISDISVKLWVNETSAASLVAQVSTGGCLNSGSGCFHTVTGTVASVTPFSPACGPDPSHLANREITITTGDHTLLAPGQTWTNLQTALRLSNGANFKPGTSTWYSGCIPGTQYKSDAHFAIYYKGNLVVSSGLTPPSCRGPQGTQKLSGYTPAEMTAAPLVGALAPSTIVRFGVGLPLQNAAALDTFVHDVSNPNSPSYRAYLTPEAFTATYAPTASTFQSVVSWATARGLTVSNPSSASRMFVEIKGSAADVGKALYANFVQRKRSDGTLFYMLDREPSLDLATSVLRLSGVDNFRTFRKTAAFGTGDNHEYLGRDLRDYFAGCTSNKGQGQRVGIFAMDGFDPLNISDYATFDGLSAPPPVTAVTIDGFDGKPTGSASDEVELDIEMAMGMAPELDEIVVFEADPASGSTKTHNSILDQMTSREPLAQQLSSSFIYSIDENTQQFLNKAVALGQSFFQASGDTGGYSENENFDSLTRWGTTLVGGTMLPSADSEVAWPGSGGGNLLSTDLPDYQLGLDMSQNGGSTANRNVPDVAMPSYFVEAITGAGSRFNESGTSVSTPLWAGFMALVNQQAAKNGNPPIGFFNPVAYAIGQTPSLYASTFRDITDGDNVMFDAVAGYDLVTGWGSPKCELITQLGATKPLAPTRTRLVVGATDTCELFSDGTAQCWGGNFNGVIGDGTETVHRAPYPLVSPGPIADISLGNNHACLVLQSGKVYCAGHNDKGELGNGTTSGSVSDVYGEVQGITDAVQVSVGWEYTCALRSNGTVMCWGDNQEGQLGDGTTTQRTSAVAVTGLTGVLEVHCGSDFTCARDSDRKVWCWGSNGKSTLGDNNAEDYRTTPGLVPGLDWVEDLSLGQYYACAVLIDGTLQCWGEEYLGIFGGDGGFHYYPTPTHVPGVSGAQSVAAQSLEVCVATWDGLGLCAGDAVFGDLGYGEVSDDWKHFGQTVQGVSDIVQVEPGDMAWACARTSAGKVYCWGRNDFGYVGNGTTKDRWYDPQEVTF